MLLKSINRSYLFIGFFLFVLFSASLIQNMDFMMIHAVSFFSFLIYGIVMYKTSVQANSFFKKRNLVIIVFFVSILEVILFQLLSYYIDGDTFVFSKRDAMLYYTVGLKMSQMSIVDGFHYMVELGWQSDDWGAFLWISSIFRIVPSLQFLGFIYCIVGTLSSLMLFDIARNLMPRRYAFMAALSFSVSSFMLVHNSQCLKEIIMIFCIIAVFECFITYIRKKENKYLFLAILCSLLVFLFRVPTALLLILSLGLTWVLLKMKGTAAIFLIVVFTIAICSTSLFSFTYSRYLRNGDTSLIIERKNELAGGGGVINQMTDPLAAFAGPFPSVKIKTIKPTPLYTAGLLYRFLLSAPFFLGVFYIIKERYIKMYPFALFFLINALGVAISVKGLEVRLSMPQLSMMYIVSFWFLAKYDYEQFSWEIPQKVIQGYFIGIMMLCFLWNLR